MEADIFGRRQMIEVGAVLALAVIGANGRAFPEFVHIPRAQDAPVATPTHDLEKSDTLQRIVMNALASGESPKEACQKYWQELNQEPRCR